MARIRTLKPELLEDEKTASLSLVADKLFTSAILLADDHGCLRGTPAYLWGQIFWAKAGVEVPDVQKAVAELELVGLVRRYVVHRQTYLLITNWAKHQRIDNAGKRRVPGPDEADESPSDSGHSDALAETYPHVPSAPAETLTEAWAVHPSERAESHSNSGHSDIPAESRGEPARECAETPTPTPTPTSTSTPTTDPDRGPHTSASPPSPSSSLPSPELIVEAWNAAVSGTPLPTVRSLTSKRRTKLKARARRGRDLSWWEGYFRRVARTPFLRGETGRGWKADFDWATRSEDNVTRVVEGAYDNGPGPRGGGGRQAAQEARNREVLDRFELHGPAPPAGPDAWIEHEDAHGVGAPRRGR